MKKLRKKRNRQRLSFGGEKLEDRYLMHGGADTSIDFEDLAPGTHYIVGDVFVADDTGVQADIRAEQFQWSDGTPFGGGRASVDNSAWAGHVGQDIQLNNVTADFDFGSPVDGLSLNFGEYGGNVNVHINSDFYNVENLADLDGQVTSDGVLIVVPMGGFGNDTGELVLRGLVDTFKIGGQELWVDHVHPGEFVDIGDPQGTEECIDFEDERLGAEYFVGDSFVADASGFQADIRVRPFTFSDGGTTAGGVARVESGGNAGHAGQEIAVNNVLLEFDFGGPVEGLMLNFGEYGGNLNILINGDFVNFEDFHEIDGMDIGGVHVSVPLGGSGQDTGTLKLEGTVESFAIGGQELWIDNICPCEPIVQHDCIDFEDLVPNTQYFVGDSFLADNSGLQADIDVHEFFFSDGTPFGGGFTQVDTSGLAGHLGQDMMVNNVNLDFDFGMTLGGLSLNFGEYGGNLNIFVNGTHHNFEDFQDINGAVIGGVAVTVPVGGFGNDVGQLVLNGTIHSFAVGGQELWIDHVCVREADDQGEFDWGDAPDQPYRTLAVHAGAHHRIDQEVFLGDRVDPESDGQPTAASDGDDANLSDDEDGVKFLTPLVPGQIAQVEVVASIDGWLNAWADLNQNGVWEAGAENIFSGQLLIVGSNILSFNVPADAVPGDRAFTRWRFSTTDVVLPPWQDAAAAVPNGEVEDHLTSIEERPEERMDWGDAPDQPYRTLAMNSGAHHRVDPDVFLGDRVDAEADGQPTAASDGDDMNGLDDEDGVQFLTPLVPGQPATVEVVASIDGWLNAWADFNQNGVWEAGAENIFSGQLLIVGSNILSFNVPADAVPGDRAFTRWRFSTTDVVLPPWQSVGTDVPNGEVEDHLTSIEERPQERMDWGDAPDQPYRTLALNSGAHHRIDPDVFLGDRVDAEADGQPTGASDGDDANGLDDEDGVKFLTPLVPGQPATVEVVASIDGWLNAWADFNQNGVWEAGAENIFSGQLLIVGSNILNFNVPAGAVPGERAFTRWRFSTTDVVLPPWQSVGTAVPNGEVEDHRTSIEERPEERLDWGDAPDQPYPTLNVSNGARHQIIQGFHLGRRIDADPNGQPTIGASGDDLDGSDDDDGVRFLTNIVPGGVTEIAVDATAEGLLDAWADFNQDGVWQPHEQIFTNEPIAAGANLLSFAVPDDATPHPKDPTYLRFRFSRAGGLTPEGPADDGEVEDYAVRRGDINRDGRIDADDLDRLWAIIANGSSDPLHDLNGDGYVDRDDHATLVQDILGTNYGDANLDGNVNAADLNIVGLNWQTPTGGWSNGDFNCDGKVDAADLNLLGLNWRSRGFPSRSAPLAADLPNAEPSDEASDAEQTSQSPAESGAESSPRQEVRSRRSTLARRGRSASDSDATLASSAWSDQVDGTLADWAAI